MQRSPVENEDRADHVMDVAAERSNVKQSKPGRRRGRSRYQVAVLVPCYNEEHAIAKVVADFRAALPRRSSMSTTTIPPTTPWPPREAAGAVVRRETHQGKGYVVRRMFNDVEADIYVLVDGDATYDAPSAPKMIAKLVDDRLDMVVATRVDGAKRRLSARPSRRQPAVDRLRHPHIRSRLHRHPVRLPGVFAAFREIVPDSVRRLRNRDRIDRARARARAARGRGCDAVLFAAERIGLEAFDLARRISHFAGRC